VNDYVLSILFGIVEGLTEFLPVSSTAHLRIVEHLCGISLEDGYWKMYSIVIQLGAILSVVVYFRHRIASFVRTFPKGANGDKTVLSHPLSLVLVAFVCTAIPALILKKLVDKNLESLWVMGTSLLVGGVVMWAVDWIFNRPSTLEVEKMSLPQAVWIGLVQVLSAIFPGTSRSMSTIAAGQTAGVSRATALEFSFFLCIPTMFAATAKELFDTLRHKVDPKLTGEAAAQAAAEAARATHLTSHQWGILIVGFVVSFLVAWGVIAWFMAWVRRRGFTPFAVYRIVAGLAVLYLWTRIGSP
jgi:undecaprenyl-diphosphatase